MKWDLQDWSNIVQIASGLIVIIGALFAMARRTFLLFRRNKLEVIQAPTKNMEESKRNFKQHTVKKYAAISGEYLIGAIMIVVVSGAGSYLLVFLSQKSASEGPFSALIRLAVDCLSSQSVLLYLLFFSVSILQKVL